MKRLCSSSAMIWGAALFGTAGVILAPRPAAAAPIPIAACPAVLNMPGATYELAANLNCGAGVALQITADNITLDGKGFTLKGPGAPFAPKSIGIEVVGTKSVAVRNVRVTGFTLGIRLRSAKTTRVYEVAAIGNAIGIQLADAHQNSVTASHFRANHFGVYLSTSHQNLIQQNWVTDNTLSSPAIVSGFSGGFFVGSSNENRIVRNTVLQNGSVGVWLYLGAEKNLVQYNRVEKTKSTGIASNGLDNRLLDNRVLDSTDGIALAKGATGHLVQGNTVLGSTHFDMTDENLPSVVNQWQNNTFTTDSEGNGAAVPFIE